MPNVVKLYSFTAPIFTRLAPVTAAATWLSTFNPSPAPAPVLAALKLTLPPSPLTAPTWSPDTSIMAPNRPPPSVASVLTIPLSLDNVTSPPLPKLPAVLVVSAKPLANNCAPRLTVTSFLAYSSILPPLLLDASTVPLTVIAPCSTLTFTVLAVILSLAPMVISPSRTR